MTELRTRLRRLAPEDPALIAWLGSTHQRFQRLVDEAEHRAAPFYERIFGEALTIDQAIQRIFTAVEQDGDAALVHYSELFDGSALPADQLAVSQDDIAAAWDQVDATLRDALSTAAQHITDYQATLLPAQRDPQDWQQLDARWTPLARVGGYVPGGAGGSLPLCSTVLMNLIPAQVAGVQERVLVTPPRPDGSVAPELLAACHAAGVQEVYKLGGIQGIAALAIGTETINRVDKIVGPGNIFVTLAKRQAYGRVDLDMLAGPSEVLVIADDSAKPEWVAADLLAQAEHDRLATAVLLCQDADWADAVDEAVAAQLDALPAERQDTARASIADHGLCVVCDDMSQAVALSDRFAPEHLEIITRDAAAVAAQITHAGAIFIGPYSPEPIGDYVAGPSHTLPTGGTARMWSGIGADTFLKRTSIIHLPQETFAAMAPAAVALARAEGLEAHARSVLSRL